MLFPGDILLLDDGRVQLKVLSTEGAKVFTEGYEGYPSWFVNIFGWGMAIFACRGFHSFFHRLKWKMKHNLLEKKENKDDKYCNL